VVHLSSDYYIVDGDQAPTSNKGGLYACSESAEPTLKSAKPTPTCSKSARPTAPAAYSESARPTASAAYPESAKSASQSAKPTTPASAQVGLADFQSAKPTFPVLAAADASSDYLTPLVDWFLEKKSNIMQIKDIHFSNMINKIKNINILLKFQSGHTISIVASIRDILANSGNRLIENSNLFVGDKINLDSIGQYIVPYGKTDGDTSSKLKLPMSNCKDVAEWIDNKSDLFVCLALKPTPQKNRLKKSKYTFEFPFCDYVFDILLKNNFIRIIDHSALPFIQNLEELTYCKWHNSSDHNTYNCNVFHRVIQLAIDNGRLRFSEAQQMDQLDSISLDGKQVLNRLAIADSLKAQGSNAQERDVEPSSEDKVVVHELQI
jgi:hypothetical protein